MLALESVVAVVAGLVLPVVAIAIRRRLLQRGGGTIDLSLRLNPARHGRGWVLGVGRFAGDDLQWYRVFSLAMRPRRTLSRCDLRAGANREGRQPKGPETYALQKGAVVLECRSPNGTVELAMDKGALTGFLAWLEAQPPGAQIQR